MHQHRNKTAFLYISNCLLATHESDSSCRFHIVFMYEGKHTHNTSNNHFSLTLSFLCSDRYQMPSISSHLNLDARRLMLSDSKVCMNKNILSPNFYVTSNSEFFRFLFRLCFFLVEYFIKIWTIWKLKLWLRECKRQKPVSIDHLFIKKNNSDYFFRIEHSRRKKKKESFHGYFNISHGYCLNFFEFSKSFFLLFDHVEWNWLVDWISLLSYSSLMCSYANIEQKLFSVSHFY